MSSPFPRCQLCDHAPYRGRGVDPDQEAVAVVLQVRDTGADLTLFDGGTAAIPWTDSSILTGASDGVRGHVELCANGHMLHWAAGEERRVRYATRGARSWKGP